MALPAPVPDAAKKKIIFAAVASFFATAWLPLLSAARFGDLSNWYNDHLHHTFAVWVFAARGFEIYTLPFAEAARGVSYAHPFIDAWGQNPMVYPPGVFLVFTPPALLGHWFPMSLQTLGALALVWLLLCAHLSLIVWWRGLAESTPGFRAFLGFVLWLMFLRMALNGFFDVVWLGFAAMMMREARAGRRAHALLWFGAAAFTHYRAAVLLPFALSLFLAEIAGRPLARWPWRLFAPTLVLGLVALWTFVLMYPHTLVAATSAPPLRSLFASELTPWLTLLVALVGAALAWTAGGWVPALTVLFVGGVTLLELPTYRHFWWHSCIVLALPAVAGTLAQAGSRLRQLGLALLLIFEALVFGDRQGGAFGLFTQLASDYRLRSD